MILSQLDRVESEKVELADFLPHTEQDVGKLYERLCTLLRKLDNPHLRTLAECFLMDQGLMRRLLQGAGRRAQSSCLLGGLLEHVVTLMESADRIAPLYAELNRDVLLMGMFLHDIGKVRELSYDRAFSYSDEGQLIGHLVLGVEMLGEQVRARAGSDRRAVSAGVAVAAQAFDRQPSRRAGVRQSDAADDAGGDRSALPR